MIDKFTTAHIAREHALRLDEHSSTHRNINRHLSRDRLRANAEKLNFHVEPTGTLTGADTSTDTQSLCPAP
ncbi:MAG: hypothetical protein JNK87_09200 [Bryobacterales bacterium]|nr:hypothetical protein [Bryobacterales bacterium]